MSFRDITSDEKFTEILVTIMGDDGIDIVNDVVTRTFVCAGTSS